MTLRVVLGVLIVVVLSLSFLVPAEDALDTAYDESESLPFECLTLVNIMLVFTRPFALNQAFPFRLRELIESKDVRHSDLTAVRILSTALCFSLRC